MDEKEKKKQMFIRQRQEMRIMYSKMGRREKFSGYVVLAIVLGFEFYEYGYYFADLFNIAWAKSKTSLNNWEPQTSDIMIWLIPIVLLIVILPINIDD